MSEAPERAKSLFTGREDATPSKPSRHSSASAKPSSMRPSSRRTPPVSSSATANVISSPGGSVDTRSSIRSSRSGSGRPPARSPARPASRKSLSGSEHRRSLSNSDHRSGISGSEHRKSVNSSEHRRSHSSDHISPTESSESSVRRTRSGDQDSLLKARDRLQGRPRTAPSPHAPDAERQMSEGMTEGLKQNLAALDSAESLSTSAPRGPRSERTLNKASRSDRRTRSRPTKSRSDASVNSMDDDGASIVSSRSMRSVRSARGRGGGSRSVEGAEDDEVSTASRSRRGSRGRRGSGRSRSRSKSSRRRPVRKPTMPTVEIIVEPEPEKSQSSSASIVSSTSKVRRKPASVKGSLGAGLSFLDDLAPKPKKGSRETRSVGADMMFSPKSSKEPKRRMVRNKSSEGGGLLAGLSMLDAMNPRKKVSSGSRSVGPDMMMTSPKKSDAPVRRMTRTRSQDAAGISTLAAFLHDGSKGAKKVKGSSRSVGAMPMPSSSGDQPLKKPTRRRLKKSNAKSDDESDDESKRSFSRKPPSHSRSFGSGLDFAASMADVPRQPKRSNIKHSASFGSGLDFYTASTDDVDSGLPRKGRKPKKRLSSSSGSGLDLHASSSDDDDVASRSRKPKKYAGSLSSGLDLYTANSDEDEMPSMKRKGRKPNRPSGGSDIDGSLHISDLMGGQGSDRKKTAAPTAPQRAPEPVEEEVDENQDDIFSFYAWSASRQARPKVLRERKKLTDTIRTDALMSVYASFVRP